MITRQRALKTQELHSQVLSVSKHKTQQTKENMTRVPKEYVRDYVSNPSYTSWASGDSNAHGLGLRQTLRVLLPKLIQILPPTTPSTRLKHRSIPRRRPSKRKRVHQDGHSNLLYISHTSLANPEGSHRGQGQLHIHVQGSLKVNTVTLR